MQKTRNSRGIPEDYLISEHAKLSRLKEVAQHTYFYRRYLSIEDIHDYPRPEFHVAQLKHDTQRQALLQIRKDEGFKDPCGGSSDPHNLSLVWWSLAVGTEEIQEAEARLLKKTYPKQTEEQAAKQKSFLWRFATSAAFSEKSIFGPYRFTFMVEEVLEAYSNQFCSGAPPIMRVFKTSLYKQEVVHVVLVHSPANQELFSKYPLLPRDDPDAVCTYKDGRFIWRPEAMCETHRYKLIQKPNENQMAYKDQQSEVFYVWDNVAIALHVEQGQVLKFDCDLLKEKITFCEKHPAISLSNSHFDDFKAAEALVEDLWPDSGFQLKEKLSLEQHFKEEPKEEPMEHEDSQE
ncbi:uncharacterized protein LOC102079137 [Oreochromis niloticus]|uniref:uncharacterized protein LOC102079137 n=1 Tax=Oreochromis niloticus TaxID=8128 RepID=UPI0003945854|nr:uncharacterized protein LOC102079137 [Oreochromis niloticus]CAI5660583.1 unnamed protein product [Mustela putorius furo]